MLKRVANQHIGPSTRGMTDADRLERKSVVPKKLLMIDDQAGMAKKVGPIAAELGLAFKALDTALTAAEVFIDFRPDIVIFDMVIPKNEGLSVLNDHDCRHPDAYRVDLRFRRARGGAHRRVPWRRTAAYSKEAISAQRTNRIAEEHPRWVGAAQSILAPHRPIH